MQPEEATPAETVLAWHEALNAGDVDRLLALSDADIQVGGPRGSGRGAQLLREWFGRAGIQLTPLRVEARGQTVVVEQDARWSVDDQAHRLASVFQVRDGKVASVIRFPDMEAALSAAG